MVTNFSQGLLRVVPETELSAREAKERKELDALPAPAVTQLAAYVEECWQIATDAKSDIETKLIEARQRRKGIYGADKLAAIRAVGGNETYIKLTQLKCVAAESWINEVLFPGNDRPWGLDPTPAPDLSPQLREGIVLGVMREFVRAAQAGVQLGDQDVFAMANLARGEVEADEDRMARQASGRMEVVIADQLKAAYFDKELRKFIQDLSTYPAAIIKGPVVRRAKKGAWGQTPQGKWRFRLATGYELCFERVSPFDFFPAPEISDVQEGFIIERVHIKRSQLRALRDADGYSADEIDAVLEEYGQPPALSDVQEDADVPKDADEDSTSTTEDVNRETVDGLELHGAIQGSLLQDWGVPGIKDPLKEYEATVLKIDQHVVRAVLNPDVLGRRPYYVTSFEKDPDSIWGTSLPEKMSHIQDVCNATVRNLVDNLAFASGPMVAVHDISRVPPGTNLTGIQPWKVWVFEDRYASGQNPMTFFQPNINAAELLAVYNRFEIAADDHTGVPRFTHGSERVGGAGRTASGLAMLFTAAARGIRNVIANVDFDIIEPVVQWMYDWNMRHHPDESLKGDAQAVPRGALALVVKEQTQLRREQFLAQTANPVDMQIVGLDGRAKLLRETVKSLDMPADEIIPSDREMAERQAAIQAALQAQAGAQEAAGAPGPPPEGAPAPQGVPV